MVKRTVNFPDDEPTEKSFPIVPVGEHKFQVIDVLTTDDIDIVSVKCEVISSNGTGISLLHRLNLNENNKFFFITRFFLKGIGEPCRGKGVLIDTDAWIGRQFKANIKHSADGKFANIKEIILDGDTSKVTNPSDIKWDN